MAVAWSYHPDAAAATGEVAGVLLEARDGRAPDLLWVAVGSEHLPDFPEIVGGLRALLEPGAAIGATVHRIPGSPADVRRRAGIAVAAVDIAHGDITLRRTAPGESPTVPDPGSVRLGYTVEARIASVVADGPDALVAAASGPRGRPGLLALDTDIRAGGMVAVDFGPASRPALTVAPACVPIGPDLTVTAATGPVVRSLGSRPPASYVIEALGLDDAPGPDLIDRLCVGVLADPTVVEPEIADLVALRVLACDSESGSFTIAGDVGTGATARLLLRDENAVLTPLSSAVADPGRAALVAVGPDAELGDARHPVGRVVEEHRDVPIAAAVHTGITVTSASRRRNGALAVAAVTFRTSAEHGVRSSGA